MASVGCGDHWTKDPINRSASKSAEAYLGGGLRGLGQLPPSQEWAWLPKISRALASQHIPDTRLYWARDRQHPPPPPPPPAFRIGPELNAEILDTPLIGAAINQSVGPSSSLHDIMVKGLGSTLISMLGSIEIRPYTLN